MTISFGLFKGACRSVLISAFALSAHAALTDLSSTPLQTYSAPSSTDVKPNLMFVLDDSGSMDWSYMPDQIDDYSSTAYWYKNSAFNGVAYNPAITYSPPAYFNVDGTRDYTTYPSMDGLTTEKGADSTTKPNWKNVPKDKYGVQFKDGEGNQTFSNLMTSAFAYVIVPGEYCNSPKLRTCITSSTPTTSYPYPALLRWCDSSALTNCRATYDSSSFSYPRIPSPRTAKITISGWSSTAVSSIKVDGKEILNATTSASADPSVVAQRVRDAINTGHPEKVVGLGL